MSVTAIVNLLTYVEPVACLAVLALLFRRKQTGVFKSLTAYLTVRSASLLVLLPILLFCRAKSPSHGLRLGYLVYFWVYWATYALEALLSFGIIADLYKLAMEPLPGLQRLGTLMFRWAGLIATVVAVAIASGPHTTGSNFTIAFVTQLQRMQSVLTICMLTFVTLASRPMGLSHRSRVFGTSLGLGVLAASDLVASNFLPHATPSMSSVYSMLNGLAICTTLGIWTMYFALPEPKRRMIVLPTTSPFLRWNQISQVLGDEPGYVALGQMTPDMFAPAEVEIMRRASAKMSEQQLAIG